MPKAVKDHRSKKNSQMHEAWTHRKRTINEADERRIWSQGGYRIDALRVRAHAGTLTEKNRKEVLALGIELE